MTEAPNRDFELVENAQEAQALVRFAAEEVCAAMVWAKNDSAVVNSVFSQYSENEDAIFIAIPTDLDQKGFVEKLAKNQSRECFMSLSASKATLFLKTDFLGFDPIGMKFKKPTRVFRVQRRKSLRYQIPKDYIVKLEFKDPLLEAETMSARASDISTGGLSFFIDSVAATSFTEGVMIQAMKITLGSRVIQADGEVRYSRRASEDPKKPFKIGIQFHQLPAEDLDYIGAYVLEGTRKYFSTLA